MLLKLLISVILEFMIPGFESLVLEFEHSVVVKTVRFSWDKLTLTEVFILLLIFLFALLVLNEYVFCEFFL